MRWFSRKHSWTFEPAELAEQSGDCPNPGRGWYRLFSMDAAKGAPLLDWHYAQGRTETLALLQIDIGAYAGSEITEEALAHIREAFLFFQREEKELLLRFVYDREGKGLEKEPSTAKQICRHMEQLAPVLREFDDEIYCIQGLFVGSWGEMHDSKFLSGQALRTLWNRLYKIAPENCFFAVRTPAQWELIAQNPAEEQRIGVFNDGLLGSETDLGTFPEAGREAYIRFCEKLGRNVPIGGEAVGDHPLGEIDSAADYFRSIHLTYLNSVFDEQVLERWKNSSFEGENGYDYIGKHLGYRFVLTDACLIQRKMNQYLQIGIENRGFAPLYEDCEICLCVEKSMDASLYPVEPADLRRLLPGEHMQILFDISGQESGEMSICLYRKRDHRTIRLANEGAGDGVVIGRLMDKTCKVRQKLIS